ncbi:unnamed protein product [Amoebophrya sp. A25]|nr:unnamed protein product [Amoebophrya sp. A25]|eukprot:GSA25T00019246001.1
MAPASSTVLISPRGAIPRWRIGPQRVSGWKPATVGQGRLRVVVQSCSSHDPTVVRTRGGSVLGDGHLQLHHPRRFFTTSTNNSPPPSIAEGTWPEFLSKESCTAPPGDDGVTTSADSCIAGQEADGTGSSSSSSSSTSTASVPAKLTKVHERWFVVPASFLVQGSVGSVYAWSLWNAPLTTSLGVVASAGSDWALQQSVMNFTTMACSLGVTTFFLGPWAERAGPRYTATVSALAYTASFCTCGAAVSLHSLPLLYCGGVLGGIGWGLGYISPVSTLLKWFPDRRGLAGGLALSAFGAGAAIAAPLIRGGLDYFKKPPVRAPLDAVIRTDVSTGTQYFGEQEVVYATKADLLSWNKHLLDSLDTLEASGVNINPETAAKEVQSFLGEGFYLVGTGDSGAAGIFFCLAGFYGVSMLAGASLLRTPPANWGAAVLKSYADAEQRKHSQAIGSLASKKFSLSGTSSTRLSGLTGKDKRMTLATQASQGVVTAQGALSTAQFPLLWGVLFCYATGGMALLSTASTVVSESFAPLLPQIVSASFAASYVSALSLSNSAGRLCWSISSDTIGRRCTYFVFSQMGVLSVLLLPRLNKASAAVLTPLQVDPALNAASDATRITAESLSQASLDAAVVQSFGTTPFASLGTACGSVPEAGPLFAFCGLTCLVMSFYGGTFSVLPGYVADLFSEKHAGAIHGRLLTAWSAASIAGPQTLAFLRDRSYTKACQDLVSHVSPEAFLERFGASTEELDTLVGAKTVTIQRLLDLCPAGTPDPSIALYDESFLGIAIALSLGGAFNSFIRPVDPKHFLPGTGNNAAGGAGGGKSGAVGTTGADGSIQTKFVSGQEYIPSRNEEDGVVPLDAVTRRALRRDPTFRKGRDEKGVLRKPRLPGGGITL